MPAISPQELAMTPAEKKQAADQVEKMNKALKKASDDGDSILVIQSFILSSKVRREMARLFIASGWKEVPDDNFILKPGTFKNKREGFHFGIPD